MDATQDLFIRGIAPPLTAFLVGAGAATACLLILAPAGAVLAAGLLVAGLGVSWLAAARARRAARRTAPARGALSARVTDLLAGAADLHAFGAQDAALARADEADAELTRLARMSAAGAALGSGLSQAVAGLTLWGVLVLGVAAVGTGTISQVPLAVITLTALAAFEAVTACPRPPSRSATPGPARPGSARCSMPPTGARAAHAPAAAGRAIARPAARGPGALRAGRAAGPRRRGPRPGRRPAGRAARPERAGKSTVAALLLRFCDLAGGSATLGGADLASYDPDAVRTMISGCAQDPHLFDTTIAANIRLARPEASQDEMAEAAEPGPPAALDRLAPAGLGHARGTPGTAVSGGEQQRIALARALLADPALLILDEPTAHLDPDNRRALTADLLDVTAQATARGRATLFITHEMDGLDQVDEIVVLDGGRVAERGTHQALLEAGGLYQEMWAAARLQAA